MSTGGAPECIHRQTPFEKSRYSFRALVYNITGKSHTRDHDSQENIT